MRESHSAVQMFDDYVEAAKGKLYVLVNEITIAVISIVCAVGVVDSTGIEQEWGKHYPVPRE
jgi:hypothetical protein